MCGLAGVIDLSGASVPQQVADRMAQAIAHRGPDGAGSWAAGPVALGHRRLSVIDLSPAAAQPMHSDDSRFSLVYNGELFNFRELRAELEGRGRRFRSHGDSEVVLHALAEWGEGALDRFNGMFALALWDSRERQLWLARDRFGVKPLYWARRGDLLLFGSEVKALLAHPTMEAQMDVQGLAEYLTFQNMFSASTLFRGVEVFPAGSVIRVRPGETVDSPRRYWDFHFCEPDSAVDERECAEELDRLFHQAVTRQLVADVPVASYLSGGMDSGSITAVAAGQRPHMRSFTVGFDLRSASGIELAYDERESAEHMSYVFQTEHYEMVLKAGDLERVMPRLIWHLEEPRVGQSYPNYYAAQLASKFGKVVLSGSGGDELFAGYPWRYYRAVVNDDFDHYVDKYYDFWQRLLNEDGLRKVLSPLGGSVDFGRPRQVFRDVFSADAFDGPSSPEDYINRSLYFEAKTFLHGLLTVEDKLSMAHGLETRVPFLDNDLVDFAQSLPVGFKLGNLGEVVRLNENEPGPKTARFFERTRDGKLILRKVMSRHIPEIVTDREKQGFSGPDSSWFRGESIDYVRRRLLDPDARIFEFLDRKATMGLVNEHLDGVTNRRLLIWSLLSLEQWCEGFLEGVVPEEL